MTALAETASKQTSSSDPRSAERHLLERWQPEPVLRSWLITLDHEEIDRFALHDDEHYRPNLRVEAQA